MKVLKLMDNVVEEVKRCVAHPVFINLNVFM
jgi:hypothetical protein